MNQIDPSIFKAYDIRGIYPEEINPEAAYKIAWAFGKYFKEDLEMNLPFSIVLGQDVRGSSPFLAREVVSGLNDQGINVVDIGRVPTPAFYYAIAFKDHAGGIMVTASHNPKQYNGFKLCREKGMPVALATGADVIKKYAMLAEMPKAAVKGSLVSLPGVVKEYVDQDLSYLNIGKIKKFKIAADPGNGMGALYLDELFKKIPVDLIKINWELNGNFPIHEANPIKDETLQQIQAVIKNENADFGIAVDGDGDRIRFLDETGYAVRGDIITAIMAKVLLEKYPGSKIGYEVRTTRAVKEIIEDNGGVPVMMPGGYSKMKPIMAEQDVLFAAEFSMHYMFRENYYNESPVFVTAQLLHLMSTLNKPFSEIWRPYQKYFHSGEVNFSASGGSASGGEIIAKIKEQYRDGERVEMDGISVYYPEWWFNLRVSNTEPVIRLIVEARDENLMKQKLEEIAGIIKAS